MAVKAIVRDYVTDTDPDPGGGGNGNSGYYAPLYTVDGLTGSPVTGENSFIHPELIGAEELTYIIVNGVIEYLDVDFSFIPATGEIIRGNPYQPDDKIIVPHRSAAPNAYYAPLWIEGNVGHMVANQFSFTHSSLIGAAQMTFIIVNGVHEYLDTDFTFDPTDGTITRTNMFMPGDKMITPHAK